MFLTSFELCLTLVNVILYCSTPDAFEIILIVLIFVCDLVSLFIASKIFFFLNQRITKDKVLLPSMLSSFLHFIMTYPVEWMRFYCAVLLVISTKKYASSLLLQVFISTTLSFWHVRQLVHNILVFIVSNDCQYVLNTLLQHVSNISIYLFVLIRIGVQLGAGVWDKNSIPAVLQTIYLSVTMQLSVLFVIMIQGVSDLFELMCPGRSSETSWAANKVSVVTPAMNPIEQSLSTESESISHRKKRKKKIRKILPKSMISVPNFSKKQAEMFGLEEITPETLLQEILELTDATLWTSSKELEGSLRWKLQFYDWSEFGFLDAKHFFSQYDSYFQIKFDKKLLFVRKKK